MAACSAQPRLAYNARDLVSDQALDNAGKMLVEPGLQKRPKHVAHDVLERAVGCRRGRVRPPAAFRGAMRRVGQTPRLPLPMSPPRRCARGRGRASAPITASRCDRPGSAEAVAFAIGASSRAADAGAGFVVSSVAAMWRTEPSSFRASVNSRMSLFSSLGRTGSLSALSSVMIRLIEAIISSIEGSEGDLALSGIEAPTKAQALS